MIQPRSEQILAIIESVRAKGVWLWCEDGQLHYKAPKGSLSTEEWQELRAAKDEILEVLSNSSRKGNEAFGIAVAPGEKLAPLAFTQLAHWHLHSLAQRPAIRQIVSVTQLRGNLSVVAFQKSVNETVRRHDALRTRVIADKGEPMQVISPCRNSTVTVKDLTFLAPEARDTEVNRHIEELTFTAIRLAIDPLFELKLLRLCSDEYLLIVVMEHLISDAISMQILLRDLSAGYVSAVKGGDSSLPNLAVQFHTFASTQRNAHRMWMKAHGQYWQRKLELYGRQRFPHEQHPRVTARGWGMIPVSIGSELKHELKTWARRRHSTLVMAVLTVYVSLVMRWCDVTETVIQYQFDGRSVPEVKDTIGYFSSVLYLRTSILHESDGFAEVMERVVTEYWQSYERADLSYLSTQVPRPGFTHNTAFNWVPEGETVDLSDLDGSGYELSWSSAPFLHPILKKLEVDNEPGILLYDGKDEVEGYIHYPLDRFRPEAIERFVANFSLFTRELVSQRVRPIKQIQLI